MCQAGIINNVYIHVFLFLLVFYTTIGHTTKFKIHLNSGYFGTVHAVQVFIYEGQ